MCLPVCFFVFFPGTTHRCTDLDPGNSEAMSTLFHLLWQFLSNYLCVRCSENLPGTALHCAERRAATTHKSIISEPVKLQQTDHDLSLIYISKQTPRSSHNNASGKPCKMERTHFVPIPGRDAAVGSARRKNSTQLIFSFLELNSSSAFKIYFF